MCVLHDYGCAKDEAVEAVREALTTHKDRIDTGGLHIDDICNLLQHCLKNDVFRLDISFTCKKREWLWGIQSLRM